MTDGPTVVTETLLSNGEDWFQDDLEPEDTPLTAKLVRHSLAAAFTHASVETEQTANLPGDAFQRYRLHNGLRLILGHTAENHCGEVGP